MDTILATMFHRSAATLYFLYFVWASIALVTGILPLTEGLGEMIGRLLFPVLVLITAGGAGVGASFWPNMARLELFAGSAFVMTLLIYLWFIGARVLSGESNLAALIVSLSYVVIPTARTVLVIILLLRQAEERKLQGD